MAAEGGDDGRRPLVVTFHSYDADAGRSGALAGVAGLLARDGHRVLVVDWGLEAPGAAGLLAGAGAAARGRGVADLVEACRTGRVLDWHDCLVEVPVGRSGHQLRLIPPGRRGRAVDWDALFLEHDFGNTVEALRREWLGEFDLVLVDSPPGTGPVAGICAVNLPDVLVALVAADPTGPAAVVEVAGRARRAQDRLPYDRGHLVVVPVMARQERPADYRRDRGQRSEAASALADLYADFVPRGLPPRDALEVLRLPTVPRWSFGDEEPVAVVGVLDAAGAAFSYGPLARLVGGGLEWDPEALEDSGDQLIRAVSDVLAGRLPNFDRDIDDAGRGRLRALMEDTRASSEPSAERFVAHVAGRVATLSGAVDPNLTAVCATLAFVIGDPPHPPAAVRALLPVVGDVLSKPSGRELIRALGGRA